MFFKLSPFVILAVEDSNKHKKRLPFYFKATSFINHIKNYFFLCLFFLNFFFLLCFAIFALFFFFTDGISIPFFKNFVSKQFCTLYTIFSKLPNHFLFLERF